MSGRRRGRPATCALLAAAVLLALGVATPAAFRPAARPGIGASLPAPPVGVEATNALDLGWSTSVGPALPALWPTLPADNGSVRVDSPQGTSVPGNDRGDEQPGLWLPLEETAPFAAWSGESPGRPLTPGSGAVLSLSAARPSPAIDPAQSRGPVTAQGIGPQDPPQASAIQIAGVLQYRFLTSPVPPAPNGNNNDLAPTTDFPTIHDGLLETAITWTLSPSFTLFADLSLENTTGQDFNTSDIEEAYVDAHDLFGVSGSGVRFGRDRIKLGFDGLLLDETIFDGGRRDGVEMRFSQLGPVTLLGFMQYALDDGLQLGNWSSSRRVWGAQADVALGAGWALTVSYRADTAADVNGGACPGIGCNTGSGFSAGIQGALVPGIDLVVEAASYTQSGDIARWYYEPSLTLDLQQLLRLPAQPVFRIWYKNFDPYTAPLDAPLGHLLTPDEFGVFNINDNLTGLGGRLDVAVTPSLGLFGLAEWGTYKDGGPNYTVYSVGIKYSLTTDILIKLSYNSYQVDGGTVTTSPISGLQLANAQMYELELTKSF